MAHADAEIAYILDKAAEAILDAEDWLREARELQATPDVAMALHDLSNQGDAEWGTLAERIGRMAEHHRVRAERSVTR
jgi:hypothetical protein